MNKRILFSLAFLLLYAIQSFGNPIDINTARQIANSFYTSSANKASAKIKSSSSPELTLAYSASEKESQNSYYIFNRENQNGFVIISGDDRISSILGYADSGSFDYNTIPDNFKYWLECYRKALENLSDNSILLNTNANETLTPVEPLLGNINYSQDKPYNNLCPEISTAKGRAVTGCAATAMAMIMRYYQYPTQGIGNHRYTTATLGLSVSADFAGTTYDWDNMLETYRNIRYTETQANAIATLMYHCGVAINMDYNETSGASDFNQMRAFVDYFNYDASTIKLRQREYYTSKEWTAMVKQELDERRPIIYNGQSVGGGHSFVCDGYDANGLFHINWGWNGSSNGYFDLNVLDPGTQGIGGGVAGFNYGQTIITGIKPLEGTQAQSTPDLNCMLMSYDKESISGQGQVTFGFLIANCGAGDFSGNIGFCLVPEDATGTDDNTYITIPIEGTLSSAAYTLQMPIENSKFPDGTYKLYPAYQMADSAPWQIMPMSLFLPEYIRVTKQNGVTTFEDEENIPMSNPEVSDFKVVGELVTGKNGTFEFTVTNTGEREFNQALGILIMPKLPIASNRQVLWIEGTYLTEGEEKTARFTNQVTLSPGDYYAYVSIYLFGMMVPIHEEPLEITVLSKSSAITETEAGKMEIYPNPVRSTLYIHTDETITSVLVSDLSGKTVLSALPGDSDNTTLNVEALPAGTYLVRISTGNEIITRKIIKQ